MGLKRLKKIINWFIVTLLIFIIIINFTLIIKSEINSDEIPDFLGYTPFIIVTGSMEPEIKTGNLIIIHKLNNNEELKVGEVVSYKSKEDGIIITHRINEIKEVNGQKVYLMKGDSNSLVDKEIITDINIAGKYVFSVPFVGNIIERSKEPLGILFILTIIISIYILLKVIERFLRVKHTHIRRAIIRK